jgi:hypothetical protein
MDGHAIPEKKIKVCLEGFENGNCYKEDCPYAWICEATGKKEKQQGRLIEVGEEGG